MTHYFRLAVLILPTPPTPRPSRNTHASENTNGTRRGENGKRDCVLESRYTGATTHPLSDFTWLPYNNFNNPGTPRCRGLIPIPNDGETSGGYGGCFERGIDEWSALKEEGRRLISTGCEVHLSLPRAPLRPCGQRGGFPWFLQ